MGAYTPLGKVWYATGNDSAKLDVITATMASSIEDGLQPRLAHQEISVGLKASIPDSSVVIPHDSVVTGGIVAPYSITATHGDFNNGFSFTGGIATVQTAGMYWVAASIGTAGAVQGHGVKIILYQNSNLVKVDERIMNDNQNWVDSEASAVLNCVPGDTIYARAYLTGANFTSTLANSQDTSALSIALVQANPL